MQGRTVQIYPGCYLRMQWTVCMQFSSTALRLSLTDKTYFIGSLNQQQLYVLFILLCSITFLVLLLFPPPSHQTRRNFSSRRRSFSLFCCLSVWLAGWLAACLFVCLSDLWLWQTSQTKAKLAKTEQYQVCRYQQLKKKGERRRRRTLKKKKKKEKKKKKKKREIYQS